MKSSEGAVWRREFRRLELEIVSASPYRNMPIVRSRRAAAKAPRLRQWEMTAVKRGFGGKGGEIEGPGLWGGQGRYGHRAGRLFAHGDLHLVVLHLIAGKPRHGYELIKSIEEATGGAYSPSPGTIYPALSLLEEQGWIEVANTEGARKLYAVTAAGRAHLDANRSTVETMMARVTAAGASRADVPTPILRAMENVKCALRLKLGRGPMSAEDARAIADILDRAVSEIERT